MLQLNLGGGVFSFILRNISGVAIGQTPFPIINWRCILLSDLKRIKKSRKKKSRNWKTSRIAAGQITLRPKLEGSWGSVGFGQTPFALSHSSNIHSHFHYPYYLPLHTNSTFVLLYQWVIYITGIVKKNFL